MRDLYLLEVVRHAGRGDWMNVDKCPDCVARKSPSPEEPQFRCRDCLLGELVCQDCCVSRHRRLPFHAIEVCADFTLESADN